ncbi:MAG: radical SAM protein [Armatimonadota bacterium]|nr:radical SAM protein [Armatimonadota bacterium]
MRATPKVEWIEITVKSALNRVEGMPFRWSINPYRGCAHACSYCMSGDTPILMGDGSTKPLGELRAGDVIYGTRRHGARRRYVRTTVRAHWRVNKLAYRIVLEDGTELIASGDHRFLSDRGWKYVVELASSRRRRPIQIVRVLGDLRERLRLLHTIDPAITRQRNIEGHGVKSTARLEVRAIEPLGVRELYDITTGTGDFIANGVVSHNCFARVTHWYLDQDGVNDWSSRIYVKVNAPEVLRRELARPSWTREQVAIGTATDPYQPAEGAYRITRRVLEALRDHKTPASIVTKSTMILRDRDVLAQLARGPGMSVYFSFTTVNETLAREIEPDVPPPARRLEVMRALAEGGVPVGVLLAPVLPGLTDDEDHLAAVVEAARDHGAGSLGTMLLHLGPVVRDAYFQYLEHKHPDLLPEYERLYRGKYAPRAYQRRVQEVVAALKRRLGFPDRASSRGMNGQTPAPAQQRLF